jgi:chemotaxis family two-component system sensor histidine kinase/response regulator PixL
MITDPTIRDQAYQYFLEEAPELLETIEQELFAIVDGDIELSDRPLRVNKLMRATHTLKGGAANVGLETIKTVAHSMEDLFKALYNPELQIDRETKKLLYASYDCLQVPLTAEFSKAPFDRDEILDRAAVIFAQLQEIFGDYLQGQDAFPTSEELGLDVVKSFFEAVVPERIQELSTVLASGDNNTIAEVLRSQAEIFQGLAESLNLPGLGEIATIIISALDTNPNLAAEITQAAIANFQQAQKQVLEGDRERGGEPSLELRKFAGIVNISDSSEIEATETETIWEAKSLEFSGILEPPSSTVSQESIIDAEVANEEFLFNQPLETTEAVEENDIFASSLIVEEFEEFQSERSGFFDTEKNEESGELMTEIWGEETVFNDETPSSFASDTVNNVIESSSEKEEIIITDTILKSSTTNQSPQSSIVRSGVTTPKTKVSSEQIITRDVRKSRFSSASKQSKNQSTSKSSVSKTVRVNLESLERLNDLVGELLINQNKNILKDEKIQYFVQELVEQIDYNEQIIGELIEIVDEVCLSPQQKQVLQELPEKLQNIVLKPSKTYSPKFLLESVSQQNPETQLNKLLELALISNSELSAVAEKIKNYNKQAQLDTKKQQRMLLNMRDELIETRMSPIGRLFNRFPRLLQQLSITHDKKAELNIFGSHILIDKTIEEKLYDPLLHLIRNSFDHGLESPEQRLQNGKPDIGTVFLRAYYQGSQTIIEVGDDGKGISIEKIKQTGIEKNLITSQQADRLPPSQLLELLFEPGFSTADKVSELSGRGVGMDVVRSQIEELNGTISIESVPGKGTTFALQIPLTLTIAKLMLTQAAGMTYAILIDAIERIIVPTSNQVQIFEGQKVLHWQTENDVEMIPVRQLSGMIEYPRTIHQMTTSTSSLSNPILLLHRQGGLVGLEVDKILGEQELVIRPLGSAIIPPRYVYGCSVLKDSSLTLVIDGAALLKDAQYRSNSMSQQAFLRDRTPAALPSQATTQQLPPAPSSSSSLISSIPQTLLVVDDSSSFRKTLAMSLEKVSNTVIQADNGINALTELKKSGKVELVVCDLEMPLMNGFQFLKAINQNSDFQDVPVIILTSRDSDKHRKMALQLGASAYLVKPCPEQELFATINKIMNKK